MRILDVGCGRGDFTIGVLAKRSASVVGMDISIEFLREARASSLSDCQFVVASASDMCFRGESFDEVHCHHVLEHVPDMEAALDGISRILAPGGRLFLSSPHPLIEKVLGNIGEGYIGDRMHRRIIGLEDLRQGLASRGISITLLERRKFLTSLLLFYRFVRGMPFEPQSGLFYQGDAFTRLLEKLTKWSSLDPEEVDFGKKKYLKGILILAKAEDRMFSHLLPHEYYLEAVKE